MQQPWGVPWGADEATRQIRCLAQNENLSTTYTLHSRDRLSDRGMIMSDVHYALKNGFACQEKEPERATRAGFFHYTIACKTPNSAGRTMGIVLISDPQSCLIKIITVMWINPSKTKLMTVIGVDENA